MKLQMLILASLALVDCQLGAEYGVGKLTTDSDFICPPQPDIKPCQCTTLYEIPTVQCNRIRSLKVMENALSARFRVKPIPYLKILNARFVGLPPRAFMNVSMTRLHIEESHLKYVVVDAFVGLENLLILILKNVRLFTLPSESFNQLSSLVTLSIPSNNLFELAYGDLKPRGLKYLSLADNMLTRLARGAFPISLVTLELSNNRLVKLNRAISNLYNLEWLFLNDNSLLTVESEFEKLYMLRHLKLGKNKLRTLGRALRNMQNLQVLELEYNAFRELGNSLRNLRCLNTLNLSMNRLIQLRHSDFEGLASLKYLYLSDNSLVGFNGALGYLPNLVGLDLSRNRLQSFSLSEINSLSRLKVLDLNENQIARISSESSSLRLYAVRLLLSKNKLITLSDFMGYLPYLEEMDVSHNKLNILRSSDFRISSRIDYINVQDNPLFCDAQQMEVYQELRNMKIEVDGSPNCTANPRSL